MKTLFIVGCASLLVGCHTNTHQVVLLTADQAQGISVQLANEKAAALYHCRPFVIGRPAHFEQGRWVWADRQGYGHGDIEVTVELAPNGSTNGVDLKLLDNNQVLSQRIF